MTIFLIKIVQRPYIILYECPQRRNVKVIILTINIRDRKYIRLLQHLISLLWTPI